MTASTSPQDPDDVAADPPDTPPDEVAVVPGGAAVVLPDADRCAFGLVTGLFTRDPGRALQHVHTVTIAGAR